MDDHLGRGSPHTVSITRIPAKYFREHRKKSCLFYIILTIIRMKIASNWDKIPWENVPLIMKVISKIYDELAKQSFHKAPSIFLHPDIPVKRAVELRRIVLRHQGEVVLVPRQATHIVMNMFQQKPPASTYRVIEEKGPLAFVHWTNFPDSYDEWLPAQKLAKVHMPVILLSTLLFFACALNDRLCAVLCECIC